MIVEVSVVVGCNRCIGHIREGIEQCWYSEMTVIFPFLIKLWNSVSEYVKKDVDWRVKVTRFVCL